MTFQGFCNLYCYSKDPVMNSINVPPNFPYNDQIDSQVEQVEGLFSLPERPFFHD